MLNLAGWPRHPPNLRQSELEHECDPDLESVTDRAGIEPSTIDFAELIDIDIRDDFLRRRQQLLDPGALECDQLVCERRAQIRFVATTINLAGQEMSDRVSEDYSRHAVSQTLPWRKADAEIEKSRVVERVSRLDTECRRRSIVSLECVRNEVRVQRSIIFISI